MNSSRLKKMTLLKITDNKARLVNNDGFTLLEVMAAMFVLGVALTAIAMMNYTSINGSASARDTTEATYLAQKAFAYMQAESEQWAAVPSTTGWLGPNDNLYKAGTHLGSQSLLKTVLNAGGNWVALGQNVPFLSTGQTPANGRGRFCLAARQSALPMAASSSYRAIRVQLAVYYQGPSDRNLTDCTQMVGNNLENLTPVGQQPGRKVLEDNGTRVSFFSYIITRPVR